MHENHPRERKPPLIPTFLRLVDDEQSLLPSHGDELVSVNDTSVSEKTYEEMVKMVRGKAGANVKLAVKQEGVPQEISVTRVAGTTLTKGRTGHGTSKEKPEP